MFDFLHRWRSVSPQTHFSAPPAFAPSLGANLTIGEIHFGPRTTQTATRRPQTQRPRENLKESGRKRSGRSLRFARATSPRVPSLTPSRARAGPGGGRKEAAERNKKAAAVGQKAPAPPRPAPRNGLAPPAPSRAGSRRAQARIQETAQRRSVREPPQRFARDRAARAQANLAVWPPPRAFKSSHRPMTKFAAQAGERSKTGRTARSAPRCAPAQGGKARRRRPLLF